MDRAKLQESVKLGHPQKVYIRGEWVEPVARGGIDVVSPITEEVIFTVGEATGPDIDLAVTAARAAFDEGEWPRLSHNERAEYLRKIAEGLRRRGDELGHAWTNQTGILHRLAQYGGQNAAALFDYYAGLAETFAFQEVHTPALGGRAVLVHEPVGVVAAIVPWNGPLELASVKLAPALLAGCTVVLKPSPEAPLEALLLAEIAAEAGLPAGVLNVVPADRVASEHLVRNVGVDKVSFTGSSAVGCHIASIVGSRMGRYTMELGGKSAALVMDDFPLEEAVDRLAGSICLLSGQVCATLSRVIVPRPRYQQFVDLCASRMAQLVAGDPYSDGSHLGPLAMRRQLDRVQSMVDGGVREGAKLLAGGRRSPNMERGYYFEPTLFADVDNSMSIAQEEIFGPVLSVIPAADEQDAIRLANQSKFGLNGAVMTSDSDKAMAVARQMRVGNVAQGGFRLDLTIAFGGVKQSGVGREGGAPGLLPYLESKTVFLD